MSESLVGLRLACTRQNAGTPANCWVDAATPRRRKRPAATGCASRIVTFGRERDVRLSHGAALAVRLRATSAMAMVEAVAWRMGEI